MTTIARIHAREILDSRGNPTVEAEVILANGVMGRASVPSGASTGKNEALELRDHEEKRFLGKGVLHAVKHINTELNNVLKGISVLDQTHIDDIILKKDGTESKSKLGANATLAVSLAASRAAAKAQDVPLYVYLSQGHSVSLPVPLMNIINGGAHADNNLDFQEFMIIPYGFSRFKDALQAGVETFHHLKSLLKKQGFNTNVGDEGGFAPDLPNQHMAVSLILEAIVKAGYKPGDQIAIGLDVASSEFYKNHHYELKGESKVCDVNTFIEYLKKFVTEYPIISIEDGMAENDWFGWRKLTETLGHQIQLVGDDLFVTNTTLLKKGIDEHIANAILIKPNQIGTLSETLNAIKLAKKAGYRTVISHRSGETEDTFIADLAVGTHANQIKTGSLCRTDRMAKYNELLRIEENLGKNAHYAGKAILLETPFKKAAP